MTRSTGRYYARQVYTLAMMAAVYVTESNGAIAVYHQGLCYVWYRNGFDGVQVFVPAKSWL